MAIAEAHLEDTTLTHRWERAESERAALIRLARRRGLSPQDAEDCVQDAIVRVVTHPFADDARLGALLTTVVKRSAVDVQRRSATNRRVVQRVAAISAAGTLSVQPDEVVCAREEAAWTADMIQRLPVAQRDALVAKADGRPVNDIARDMATTPKAVESLISRARAKAREAWATGMAAAASLVRWSELAGPTLGAAAAAIAMALSLPLLAQASGQPVNRAVATSQPREAAPAPETPASGPHSDAGNVRRATTSHGGAPSRPAPKGNTPGRVEALRVDHRQDTPAGPVGTGGKVDTEHHDDAFVRCVNNLYTLGLNRDDPLGYSKAHCRDHPGSVVWED